MVAAIFLRNGGNAFERQTAHSTHPSMALGHTTLQMVQMYLAQTDLDAAHRKASPVENWRL